MRLLEILQQAIEARADFKPMSNDRSRHAAGQNRSRAAAKGEFEQYKTTHNFDGTYHNPQWLG